MPDKSAKKISFEIAQIDHLLATYSDLLATIQTQTPDIVQTTAAASLLHSFYNGIENIFKLVANEIDQVAPEGHAWHHQLIEQMARQTNRRAAVISPETADLLMEYLSFRHFYRHSYSFFLEWARMEGLIQDLAKVWHIAKDEIQAFLADLLKD